MAAVPVPWGAGKSEGDGLSTDPSPERYLVECPGEARVIHRRLTRNMAEDDAVRLSRKRGVPHWVRDSRTGKVVYAVDPANWQEDR